MSVFPWESGWEMAGWFCLVAGLWHYSDQLSADMTNYGFLGHNRRWLRYAAICLGLGIYPALYLGVDLVIGEANRVAQAPFSWEGRLSLASIIALGVMLLASTARFFSVQHDVLVQRILTKWDFEFDDLLDEQVWMGHTVNEVCSLNNRLGRGRLAIAVLSGEGEIVALAVKRAAILQLEEQESFQIAAWAALEGSQNVSISFRPEEDIRLPTTEETLEAERLVKSMNEKGIQVRVFLYHNGTEGNSLFDASQLSPLVLKNQVQGLLSMNRESTPTAQ